MKIHDAYDLGLVAIVALFERHYGAAPDVDADGSAES